MLCCACSEFSEGTVSGESFYGNERALSEYRPLSKVIYAEKGEELGAVQKGPVKSFIQMISFFVSFTFKMLVLDFSWFHFLYILT